MKKLGPEREKIRVLAFADDLAVLYKSIDAAKAFLVIFHEIMKKQRVFIGWNKCGIMSRYPSHESLLNEINTNKIPFVKEYKYLGVYVRWTETP